MCVCMCVRIIIIIIIIISASVYIFFHPLPLLFFCFLLESYMLEYPVARALADARVPRIYGGANEIMKELIGRTCKLRA